jgi:hypothetical protein
MLARRILSTLALLLTGAYANAQQPGPQLLTVFPPGAKAGSTVEVTLAGHNLDGAEKLLFSAKPPSRRSRTSRLPARSSR